MSSIAPMKLEQSSNHPEFNVCETCGDRVFTCVNDWLGGYLCGDRVFTYKCQ